MNFKTTLTKKLALLALSMLTFTITNAQAQFGIKAGPNFSTFGGKDASGAKTLVGFHAGGLVKIPLSELLSFQPELLYSTQGAKGTDNSNGTAVDFTEHLNYLNIPALLKFTDRSGFMVETGPQLGILLSANVKIQTVSVDIKSQLNSTDFAWVFGAGYLFPSNIGVDLRYNLGLSTTIKNNNGNTGSSASVKNNVFQLGVFYMFRSSK